MNNGSTISLCFSDEPTKQENLVIKSTLSKAKYTIYEAYSESHSKNYAVKAFPKTRYGTQQYQNEKLMCHLNHRNIARCIPVRHQDQRFNIILTEMQEHGDFLKLVMNGFLDEEILVRTYFQQLISGIEYMHQHGVAHLDLKLENILVGRKFQLKIIDFDQAQPIADPQNLSLGSKNFRAPEVINKTCKSLSPADIFSAGVILYSFMAREYPFQEIVDPEAEDMKSYAFFTYQNAAYWRLRAHAKGNSSLFSPEFIQLVNGMLHPEPEKRFTMREIKNCKWFTGPVLGAAELESTMKNKYEAFQKKSEKQN